MDYVYGICLLCFYHGLLIRVVIGMKIKLNCVALIVFRLIFE